MRKIGAINDEQGQREQDQQRKTDQMQRIPDPPADRSGTLLGQGKTSRGFLRLDELLQLRVNLSRRNAGERGRVDSEDSSSSASCNAASSRMRRTVRPRQFT